MTRLIMVLKQVGVVSLFFLLPFFWVACARSLNSVNVRYEIAPTDVAGVCRYVREDEFDVLFSFTRLTNIRGDYVLKSFQTPKGFDLTPLEASWIYTHAIHHRAVQWGDSMVGYMFFDHGSYYVADTWPWPVNRRGCNARENESASVLVVSGVKINGKDGTVFNCTTGNWEVRSYLHKTVDELRMMFPEGTDYEVVVRKFGGCLYGEHLDFVKRKAYSISRGNRSELLVGELSVPSDGVQRPKDLHALYFLCKEGKLKVEFKERKLSAIIDVSVGFSK